MHAGQTTGDGLITLEHIGRCNAACDYAPVVMVNWEFFDNQTPASARELVEPFAPDRLPNPPGCPGARSPRPREPWPGWGRRPPTPPDPAPRRWPGCRWREQDESATPLTPVRAGSGTSPEPWTLQTYQRHEGYQALRTALGMKPDDVIATVRESRLRARRRRVPRPAPEVVVHSAGRHHRRGSCRSTSSSTPTRSEPGTCKRTFPLLFTTPHFLVEGAIIAACMRSGHGTPVYVRGEVVVPVLRRLQNAVAEAYEAGYPEHHSGYEYRARGRRHGSALLDARPDRSFPACPTVANNVEIHRQRAASILRNGVDWFKSMGSEKSPGFTLYRGHVTRPGSTRRRWGITLRELLDYAGGVAPGTLEVLDPGRLVDHC